MSLKQSRQPSVFASLVACLVLTLASCGGDEASASAQETAAAESSTAAPAPVNATAKKAAAPKVDPEARYNGKTLDEYTAGLKDLNPAQRKRALQNILKFGPNAYPLKEQMQIMAVEDGEDELRAGAIVALYEMEDPDADQFVLERLRDPKAFQNSRGWVMFLQVAAKEIEAETLAGEASGLASTDMPHAEMLFAVTNSGGFGPFNTALSKAIVKHEHSDASVAILMPMLSRLELSPGEQVAYITENYKRLPNPRQAITALQAVGDEAAFDAAMTILAETESDLRTRILAVSGFPADKIPGSKKMAVIAGYFDGAGEPEVQQIFSNLQSLRKSNADEASAERYQAILVESASASTTDLNRRGLAILYLCDAVAAGDIGSDGLEPVFSALESDPEEVILGTAIQQLQKMIPRAPAEVAGVLPTRMAKTMYARDSSDKWSGAVAQGMLDGFRAGLGKLGGKATIHALATEVDAHPGSPVNFQVLQWLVPLGRQLMKTDADMVEAGALAGRLIVDGSMGPAQAEWVYSKTNLSAFNNTSIASIDTIIAFFEPILMTEELADHQYFKTLHGTAIQTLFHVRGTADGEKFLEFAKRMANEAPPSVRVTVIYQLNFTHYKSFSPAERKGVAQFKHELAGKPARIKPMVFNIQARPQVLSPANFMDGEAGEAFLLSQVRGSNPPSLGLISQMPAPMAVAFLDAQGKVVAVGSTDDASLQAGTGNNLGLTHPQAVHAILFKAGEFDLPVGTETGIDPAFLAAF